MRTDVKVGLICVFGVVLLVVIYFVAQGNGHPRNANGNMTTAADKAGADKSPLKPSAGGPGPTTPAIATTAPSLVDAKPVEGKTGPSLDVAPPTGPSGGDALRTLAQATPSGGPGSPMGGSPLISPPSPTAPVAPGSGGSSSAGGPGLGGGTPVAPGSGGAGSGGSQSILPPPSATTLPSHSPSGGSSVLGGADRSSSIQLEPSGSGRTPSTPGGYGTGNGGSILGGGTPSGTSSAGSRGLLNNDRVGGGTGTGLTGGGSLGGTTTHTIQKGDMLGTIAKKYGVTTKAIEAANPGIDSTRLKVNAKINIPAPTAASSGTSLLGGAGSGLTSSGGATTRPGSTTRPAARTAGGTAAKPAAGAKPGSTYTVKRGDTLAKIAEAVYGDKKAWKRIFRANRGEIADADVVPVGTVLRLPG
jgi:nucleoid-associated protein YgaU